MYLSSISTRLLLHDTSDWMLKKSYGCYDGILRNISWSDDSKYLLQVNGKGLVEILCAVDQDVRSLQHIPLKDTWTASFHREGHRNIAIGTKSGKVMIWDTKNKNITKTFPTPSHQSTVEFISFNARNNSLAATTANGDTIIYGLVSNIPVLTVRLPCSNSISAMKFHHESRSLLGLATEEGHIVLRDITTNKDRSLFENVHASPVSDFVYSLVNKDVMLSCGYDKMMHVYDVRLQNVVSTTRTAQTLTSLAINIDNLVALGTKSGTVLLYDLRDLINPLTTLKGHNEEVRKVAFQPLRKKAFSTEISLREDKDSNTMPVEVSSPKIWNRNSDMFYATDTPPEANTDTIKSQDNKADSFLVLMGLDNSCNNNILEDVNISSEMERKGKNLEKSNNFEAEEDTKKMSTPLHHGNKEDNFLPSPIFFTKGEPNDNKSSDNLAVTHKQIETYNNNNLQGKSMEELKDFIKLTVSDVSEDNRSYFLHIMMALTKQNLFLEKQMVAMNEQLQILTKNYEGMIVTNRKLAYEIDLLKSEKRILGHPDPF